MGTITGMDRRKVDSNGVILDDDEELDDDSLLDQPAVRIKSGDREIVVSERVYQQAVKLSEMGAQMTAAKPTQHMLPGILPEVREAMRGVIEVISERTYDAVSSGRESVITYSEDTTIEFMANGVPYIGVVKTAMKAKPAPPPKD